MQRKGYIKQEELDYIKSNFSEETVKQLRACFFSEIKPEDRETFGKPETIRLLKKIFIPEYDIVNGEIFDNPDTVSRVEPMGFDFDTLTVVMKAQLKAKELISNTIERLAGNAGGATPETILKLNLGTDSKANAQEIFNRATTMRIIESGLQGLYTIAKKEEESLEERKIRISKNSLK